VAERFARLVGGRAIHLRGFHYVLVSAGNVIKPDGRPYENNELQIELNRLVGEIPTPDPPERLEAEVDEDAQRPLIDSRWGFAAGSRALKARKAYEGEEPGGESEDGEE
jgi:hypothetical protein